MSNKEFINLVHSDDLGLKLNGLFQVVALVTQLKPEDGKHWAEIKCNSAPSTVTMDDEGGGLQSS